MVDAANTRVLKEEQYKHRDKERVFSRDTVMTLIISLDNVDVLNYYNAAINAHHAEQTVKNTKKKL